MSEAIRAQINAGETALDDLVQLDKLTETELAAVVAARELLYFLRGAVAETYWVANVFAAARVFEDVPVALRVLARRVSARPLFTALKIVLVHFTAVLSAHRSAPPSDSASFWENYLFHDATAHNQCVRLIEHTTVLVDGALDVPIPARPSARGYWQWPVGAQCWDGNFVGAPLCIE